MKNIIFKTAIHFIKKELNNKNDFKTISEHISSKGYTIAFFNDEERPELVKKYKLKDFVPQTKAFTIKRKDARLIYISSETSPEDKLYLLLHEAGHIVLGHLETSKLTSNILLQEMEADAFAYTVLNPPRNNKLPVISAIVLTAILSFTLGVYSVPKANPTSSAPYIQEYDHTQKLVPEAENEQSNESEYVYITPTGKKYHKSDCRYVKGKNCTKLISDEAQKNYEPCSVCNP